MRLQKYVEAMQPGWNLGNTFDALGEETAWGNPKTTREMIDFVAQSGFKSLRLPVTWGHRMGEAPDYRIDPAFLERIREVVDWALDAGMMVLLNMHHDSHWIYHMDQRHDAILDQFRAAWVQIADYFKEYPDSLLFEGINEPRFSDDWGENKPEYYTWLEELNLAFYEIVRNSGGNNDNRPLMLTTVAGSYDQPRMEALVRTIKSLQDPNIIATVHYYGSWAFSTNIGGNLTFNDGDAAKESVDECFDRIYQTLVAEGIPTVLGEFGLFGFHRRMCSVEHGEVLKFFEYTLEGAKKRHMPIMLWDDGYHLNRTACQWNDPSIIDLIMASRDGRSSTAFTDTVYIRRGSPVQPVEIPLQLNGNMLLGVQCGDSLLTEGKDYQLTQEDTLVLSAELLESLAGLMSEKDCGTAATLSCAFSAGPNWKIEVIVYEPVQLYNTEGTVQNFAIPAAYNGDRLATMEAVYPDGGNAGPAAWTPFKEFNAMFWPDYAGGQIHLTEGFFQECQDGEIALRFHFWGGGITEYLLTKNQEIITGRAIPETVGNTLPAVVPSEEKIQSKNSKKRKIILGGALGAAAAATGLAVWLLKRKKK
ncbi:MAG TPA: cellulase family glycosylhydrolase [Firmicutes bacterium]|nr:cellulase family glycosylhydrolase [Bacillota bacterium]